MVASIRVLVVDDCRDAAYSMSFVLKFLGCDVQVALNGEMAVEEAERFKPDLLLLDLGLPETDGFAVARRIRQMPELSQTLIVAHTGYGNYRQQASEAGFDEYLLKPASIDCLREVLGWGQKIKERAVSGMA